MSVSSDAFEGCYWGSICDPDGKRRNRLEEDKQFLEDIAEELAYVDKLSSGKVLDVGCGPGWFLAALDSNWEKHGCELSKLAAEAAADKGTIFCGDILDAPYQNEMFDLIFCHHVIEHLPKPEQALERLRTFLKPGGKLILGTPDFDSACARRFGTNYRLLHDKTHISLFSADSMRRFLRDFGFQIEHVAFPFFETRHFTKENLLRLFDTDNISPPFYGNFMTFYAQKASSP